MNLILLRRADFTSEQLAVITGRRARHVLEVHRAEVGDSLSVGELGGKIGTGIVRALDDQAVTFEVELTHEPPPPSGLELLLAMPRPKILRRVLRGVASMGVKRVVLVNSFRVEKSYFGSPVLAAASLEELLLEGLEQGRDTVLPEIVIEKRFKPFVEDRLGSLWPAQVAKVLPHPTVDRGVDGLALGGEKVVVAIGPEGGWIPYEVERLAAHGFQGFSLGPRILRVDTAVPFVLGQLELLRAQAKGRPGLA